MKQHVETLPQSASRPPNADLIETIEALYPEAGFAGFSRVDTTMIFYTMVNALLQPHMQVLDFGAGRGSSSEWQESYLRRLMILKGKCATVTGFDLDPIVRTNPLVDEAVVGTMDGPLPFPDASFDVIVSRATFEHVADPAACAAELGRILKPGGWLCAWTPNKWGVIALGAVLVPERLHGLLLGILDPVRQEKDIFPTHYRMNTLGTLRRLFPNDAFRHASYTYSGEPTYHGNRVWLARLWQVVEALLPGTCRRTLHIFIQKRA